MMKASFKEEIEYLKSLANFTPAKVVSGEYELGLGAIRELLSMAGNPQDNLKIIHVAGTNGKGSTIAFLSQILIESGLKVGVYTSPALLSVTEQIRINNTEISEDDLAEGIRELRPYIEKMASLGHKITTEFETITTLALLYFLKKSCDIVILECGLGGEEDATNVITKSLLSAIASIGFDHMEILGDTLEKIAEKKAGIIKENGTVVVLKGPEGVMKVFDDRCKAANARLIASADVLDDFPGVKLGLKGQYQRINANLAINCARALRDLGIDISDAAIRAGLENAVWPCRFEVIGSGPLVVIDGSHNIDGVRALKDSLVSAWPDKKFKFIAGVLKDKSYEKMMDVIIPFADKFYAVKVDSPRALPAEDLADYINSKNKSAVPFASIEEAVNTALSEASGEDVICIFGSLYYVGAARKILLDALCVY